MKIEFDLASDSNYVMNPQTEKRAGRRLMRMSQHGCTHFLIVSSPLNVQVVLNDAAFRDHLVQMSDDLLCARDSSLPGQEDITVTCVSYMAFRKDNEYIELPDKAANYAVCGCHLSRDGEKMRILMPTAGMGYRTSVAVELRYTMKPYTKVIKKLFRTETERTPFYEVNFEKKNSFVDGGVIYTVGQKPYRFSITKQMLGKPFLIRTDGEIPKFESTNPGVILRNE